MTVTSDDSGKFQVAPVVVIEKDTRNQTWTLTEDTVLYRLPDGGGITSFPKSYSQLIILGTIGDYYYVNVGGKLGFVLKDNTKMTPHEILRLYYVDLAIDINHEDLSFSNKSRDELLKDGLYTGDFGWYIMTGRNTPEFHEYARQFYVNNFTFIANALTITSSKLRVVALDLVKRFTEVSGTPVRYPNTPEYSHPYLTEAVKNHKRTNDYMDEFTATLKEMLYENGGDIKAIVNNNSPFRTKLRDNGVYFSTYVYEDGTNGLSFIIHSWTESIVDVKNFVLKGNTYNGTLVFTFKDNFGLDSDDLKKYLNNALPFRAWYVLQHYNKFSGSVQPYKTVVVIEYPFSGTID
jgi:hypothetical protein